uniref:Nucleoside-diphosphate kinase n=1 Tax=Gopherus evgoodei TaxID=1825980 RepID=A0A8C4VE26_9SAUR
MVEALLIHQPEDPISFMVDHLKQDSDHVPRVFVLGPPAAGKTTIAMWLCKHLNASYLSQKKLLSNKTLVLAKEAQSYQQRQEQIPDELWVALLQDRLLDVDCVREGWVLDGFPQTREQALLLQTSGIMPRHVVVLYAPDTVLVERNLGRRLDPVSAEHLLGREIQSLLSEWDSGSSSLTGPGVLGGSWLPLAPTSLPSPQPSKITRVKY